MVEKDAPKTENLRQHKRDHSPAAIARRLDGKRPTDNLRDLIYGAIDGAITTFAVVSGVAGAGLSDGLVVIMGIANLIADGFSMAVSNFLATRAEEQQVEKARSEEEEEIRIFPEGEREEIRQIFMRKGFEGEELDAAVEVITSDITRWVDTMLQEEHGLPLGKVNPWRAAAATMISFLVIGAIPLSAFCVNVIWPGAITHPFVVSSVMTGFAFFLVGAFKSLFIVDGWFKAGVETLLVGGLAAALAYGAGMYLKHLVPM